MKKLLLLLLIAPMIVFSQSFFSKQLIERMLVLNNAVQIDYVEFNYGESSEFIETLDLIIFRYSDQFLEKSFQEPQKFGGVFVPPDKKQLKRLKAILKDVEKNKDIVIRISNDLIFSEFAYHNGMFFMDFDLLTSDFNFPLEDLEDLIFSNSQLDLSIDEMKDFISLLKN